MDKIIDVDSHVAWQSSVFVRIGDGIRERIDAPDAALAALLHRWPSSSQSEDVVAKRRCGDAISKQGNPELARVAYVEAAVSAKVVG